MAGIRGDPPTGIQNAFRHGLAGIAKRGADGVLNPAEQSVREESCSAYWRTSASWQISTAMRVLAEIFAGYRFW